MDRFYVKQITFLAGPFKGQTVWAVKETLTDRTVGHPIEDGLAYYQTRQEAELAIADCEYRYHHAMTA